MNFSKNTTVRISVDTWCRLNKLRDDPQISLEDVIIQGIVLQEKETKLVVTN